MHLVRTRPFKLPQDIEAIFEGLPRPGGYRFAFGDGRAGDQAWLPRADIIETETGLTIRYELAGFELDDLEVTLDGNVLTVKGSRTGTIPEGAAYRLRELPEGRFSRSIRVAKHLDPDSVEARFSKGILEVTLDKRADVLPRTIQVRTA